MCTEVVSRKDLHELLYLFEKKSFEATVCFEDGNVEFEISKKAEQLFKLDYSLFEIENPNGLLSSRYPVRILIPEYEHGYMTSTLTANANAFTNCSCNGSTTTTTSPTKPTTSTTTTSSLSNGLTSNNSNCLDSVDGEIGDSSIHTFVTFANPLEQSQQHQCNSHTHTNSHPNPHTQAQKTIYEDLYDVNKIRELVTMAKYARCRQRFSVPVIMYRGKYICRSATISVVQETYGRKVVDYAYDCLSGSNNTERPSLDDENNDPTEESLINQINVQMPFSYDEVIKSDIQLLNALKVSTIVDLMVEKRKVKYFVTVSSSEKADPCHYENFNLLSLPYPGCEFFKNFRDNNYVAKNLYYDWNQSFNDASISVPKLGPTADLDICWHEYKQWDLIEITQNYLKAILKYIQEENSGLLIHCISGWDRTPLFISLVRLSLWADGLIHQSLNPTQITYFTLAYDWFMFGHQLPDRLKRGEDIMFFCFHVLKHITEEDFSIIEHRKRTKTSSSSGSSSVIVIKQDCDDEQLRDINFDQDSNDSLSNGSNCDMQMNDNFFMTASPPSNTSNTTSPNPLTNRSPNPKRSKTSPITVPGSNTMRQRQESTSSNGSWQVVTETGSIDSSMNGSFMQMASRENSGCNSTTGCGQGATPGNCNSNGSGCNGTAGTASANSPSSPSTQRRQRLNRVRAIFIQSYGKTIGLKFKEGSSMTLATFIGSLADQLF
ncbi:myotubularin-related protein 14-like [Teleopsis dalmanni]|uniref:myotubularin-related protein 14-like n=1 Tax=Teleopsis dalmanni TaxID=139649 RepID=UPI0018CCD312|nr:myotubularin-related protein 14-like [Teleopsis dalmanni]XP_037947821.1 myotubularin-related protein 14-like [Teleopsis dalmanni]